MSPRRGALVLAVAVSALASGFGAPAARASNPASQNGKICVAIVVDGRALGSDVSSSCAKVDKGATGIDVLEAAGHRFTFRNDGLLCTIDGLPKSGCADVDDSHYWAYFHRAPGKTNWTYSNQGPSTYEPVNTSTEGWVYDDGSARTPENVPYSTICKPAPKPTPTPRPTATHHHSHHPTPAPSHRSAAASSSATPSPSPTPTPTPHHRHRGSPNPSSTPPHRHHTSTPTPLPSASAQSPAATPAALVGGNPPTSNDRSGLAVIVGVVAVAALGGLAFYRFRRSSP